MDLGSSEANSEAFLGETSFCSACGCEFCEVVGGADHGPFGFDLVDAAQEKLAEASCLLDLAEDGLDDLFSQPRPRADDPQPCRSGRPEPASAGPPPQAPARPLSSGHSSS